MDPERYGTFLKGMTLLQQGKFDECQTLVEKDAGSSMLFGLLYHEMSLLKGLYSEDKGDIKMFNKRLERTEKTANALNRRMKDTISKSERALKKSQDQETVDGYIKAKIIRFVCKVVLAESSLEDAMMLFKQSSLLKGGVIFRKAWGIYKDCIDLETELTKLSEQYESRYFTDPLYVELGISSLYFGLGFYHFVISIVPRQFRSIVEGLGFVADRELAKKELERAASIEGGMRSRTAKAALAWIAAYIEEDFDSSRAIIDKLFVNADEPLPMFHNLWGYVTRKFGHMDESLEYFRKSMEEAKEMPALSLTSRSEIALCLCLQLKWTEAVPYLEQFCAETQINSHKMFATYLLALCRDYAGDKDEAMRLMRMLLPWKRKGYAFDDYAARNAQIYIAQGGLGELERRILEARHLTECWEWEAVRALAKLEPLGPIDTSGIELPSGNTSRSATPLSSHSATASGTEDDDDDDDEEDSTFIDSEEVTQQHALGDQMRILWFRGLCYKHLGQKQDAESHFMMIVSNEKKFPRSFLYPLPNAFTELGEDLMNDGNYDLAHVYLKRALTCKNYDYESTTAWRVQSLLERNDKLKKQAAATQ